VLLRIILAGVLALLAQSAADASSAASHPPATIQLGDYTL
jgi:hypothetical protein